MADLYGKRDILPVGQPGVEKGARDRTPMKKKEISLLALAAVLFFPGFAWGFPVSGCPGNFKYYTPATIDHTKVPGSSNLSDFPMLFNSTDSRLKTAANGGHVENSNGYDIVFANSSGSVKYDHEIEHYDGSAGTLVAWVEIPVLYCDSNTTIYMYYGNSSISSSQEQITGVWDASFIMVQHLEETSGTDYDSTSNDNDGTPVNGVTQNATGQIDGADSFDGNNDYVNCGNKTSLDLRYYLTIEAWVKPDTTAPAHTYHSSIVDHGNSYWFLILNTGKLCFLRFKGGSFLTVATTTSISAGTWTHVAATYNYGVTNEVGLYINGQLSTSGSLDGPIDSSTSILRIGDRGNLHYFDGSIDEVRVSNTYRSADWIETCYNNQSSPTTFCILETETLVRLTYFDASGLDSEVLLEWKTDAEVGTAGFNVLRAEAADGPWVRLNLDLIPSRGNSWQGASYEFSDEQREPGAVYWYSVEEVSMGGGTARYPGQLVWDEGLTDADDDGMPDIWEQRLGIDTARQEDASTDTDGDGATNREEYLAGTSPIGAGDCPRLSIWRHEGAEFAVLTWSGRAGRSYELFAADSLAGLLGGCGCSRLLLVAVQATRDGPVQAEDVSQAEERERFYRLIISPPR